MNVSAEHIVFALEPLKYLNKPLVIGSGLFNAALDSCRKKEFEEGIQLCCELYERGLERGDSYIQGVARLALGSIYFASGDPSSGWEYAVDQYKLSVGLFHTLFVQGCERNEGIAEFALGRLHEKQCTLSGRDKWNEAIAALEKSKELICDPSDPLVKEIEDYLRLVTKHHQEWHSRQSINQTAFQSLVPQTVQPVDSTEIKTPSQPINIKEDYSTMGANQPNVNKGNYAIKVVCIEERPIRRIFSPPYRLLIAIGIILIAIAEVVGAMWILQDDQARTVILVFLFLTLLTLIGLVYWWWLRVRVGTGSLGIVIGGEQPQFIQPGTFWLIPFTERLFDTVPTQPMTYNWRVEFRENETSVVPDIYQEILIQYQVAQGDPLKRAVLNRLALDGKDAGHPMPEYWLNQVSRGLQRYFEDLPPALVTDKIRNPETKIFEQEIQSTLQNLADAQGWGIQFPDVHTRYYHFKNGKG